MLATLVPEPFHRSGWVYEEKYDGDRILAYKEGAQEWTADEKLRQPAFLGLRDDKSAREVLLPGDSPEKFKGK
jgi:ATP-dependent DNA ligase